jgi:putative transposase
VFPQTVVQTCIVHLIRNSLAFVSWKDPGCVRTRALGAPIADAAMPAMI